MSEAMGIDDLRDYLNEYIGTSRSDQGVVDALEESLDVSLPLDFVRFHTAMGGGEGFIGEQYVIVWSLEEITTFNQEYEVEKYASGILLFGSNGGGEAFGFDLRNKAMPVVMIPFVGMELDAVRVVAGTFRDFVVRLGGGDAAI